MAMRYDEEMVFSPLAGSLDGIGRLRGEGASFLAQLEREEGLFGGRLAPPPMMKVPWLPYGRSKKKGVA